MNVCCPRAIWGLDTSTVPLSGALRRSAQPEITIRLATAAMAMDVRQHLMAGLLSCNAPDDTRLPLRLDLITHHPHHSEIHDVKRSPRRIKPHGYGALQPS